MDPSIEVFEASRFAGRGRYANHSRDMVQVFAGSWFAKAHAEVAELYERADAVVRDVDRALEEE